MASSQFFAEAVAAIRLCFRAETKGNRPAINSRYEWATAGRIYAQYLTGDKGAVLAVFRDIENIQYVYARKKEILYGVDARS